MKLGDTDTGGKATCLYPVQYETVQIRVRGRSENERRNLNLSRRLMRRTRQ
jgi:hypothetical protein